jgi:uncharacterized protein (DUF302 family)
MHADLPCRLAVAAPEQGTVRLKAAGIRGFRQLFNAAQAALAGLREQRMASFAESGLIAGIYLQYAVSE